MISLEEKKAMQEALGMVSRGEKYVRPTKTWIPQEISESEAPLFTQVVKEAYESDATEVVFNGETYAVSFVKENKEISMKPSFNGSVGVYLGEQLVKSLPDTRQAKVFMTYMQKSVQEQAKPSFNTKLIEKVTLVD